MSTFLTAWLAAILAFLVIDGLWLGVIAKSFYARHMGPLLRQPFLVVPAAVFYLLYTIGLVFLAVRPHEPGLTLSEVALYGATVGLLSYGTYNMTNLATLRDWPKPLAVVDMVWGSVLSSAVAVIAALAVRYLG